MSGEGLTVFERRFESWEAVHPRQSVPATDRQDVLAFISSQTKEIVSAQIEAADRIIVSQDRISSGIDKVGVAVERVAEGLEGLEAAFEWGFSEIVWHLEQERVVLKDILKVLQAPLDTQAKELRQRAEEAYKSGWIDDALEDFLESERKNRYDFTVHYSLGNIYFFHKKDPQKALEYFEKAAKYATPKSPYHASIAFLHIGLVKYLQENFQGAYEATKKAIELSPNLYEGYYECARYCACLGKYDEAIEHLDNAIKGGRSEFVKSSRNYCLKADAEKDFDVMRQQLHSFYSDLLTKAQNQSKGELAKAKEMIAYAESYGLSTDKSEKFGEAKRTQSKAEEFLKRGSLFDSWDTAYKAWYVQKLTLRCLENHLSDQISRATEEHSKAREKYETEKFERKTMWWEGGWIFAILGMLIILAYHPPWLVLCAILIVIIYSVSRFNSNFRHKGGIAHYESELPKLQDILSEVKNKRNLLLNALSEGETIEQKVIEIVSWWTRLDGSQITRETLLVNETRDTSRSDDGDRTWRYLYFMKLEDEFGNEIRIHDQELPENVRTVGDLIDYIVNSQKAEKKCDLHSEKLERLRPGTEKSGLEDEDEDDEEG
jgi:tetratricopeptide (TPR) repeat protein